MSWWKTKSYDVLFNHIRNEWDKGKCVYSLVADDTSGIFGVFFIEGYGNGQGILSLDPYNGVNWYGDIANYLQPVYEGKSITSCTSKDSTYYFIMTENVIGYHGERQIYFTYQ